MTMELRSPCSMHHQHHVNYACTSHNSQLKHEKKPENDLFVWRRIRFSNLGLHHHLNINRTEIFIMVIVVWRLARVMADPKVLRGHIVRELRIILIFSFRLLWMQMKCDSSQIRRENDDANDRLLPYSSIYFTFLGSVDRFHFVVINIGVNSLIRCSFHRAATFRWMQRWWNDLQTTRMNKIP